MSDIKITVIEEPVSTLEAIGMDEGCTTSSSTTSLDISDVEVE